MPRRRHAMFLVCLVLGMVSSACRSADAQIPEAERTRLAAEIEASVDDLDPARFPQLVDSKASVATRIEAVRSFFARATTPENGLAWMDYLQVDPLDDAILTDASPSVLAREAIDLRYRLIGTAPGLELTALTRLRQSVEQLIESIRFRDPERAKESLARQLTALAQRVRALDDNPSADDLASISALSGVLASSGQAPGLVITLRNTFNRPNVAILIGEPLVQTAIYQKVNQSRPVRDCILGTRIIGDATLNGTVTGHLIPAVGHARLNLTLTGNVVSNSLGYNGPVRLRTVGFGDVTASRQVMISDSGIVLSPVQGQASLRTEIRAIEHKLRLVRKIARKKAAEQKPRAERIATGKMRRQVVEQFASQTREATAVTTPDTLSRIRPLLKRLSLEEPSRNWSSSDRALVIDTTFRRHDQLSSIVSRPPITHSFHAAIQIHETVIDNAVAPVLAGRTLREDQLNELLEQAGRPTPPRNGAEQDRAEQDRAEQDDAEQDDAEPPFEIDFHRFRPIIFEARNQMLRVGVRGTRFAQGGREIRQPMEITATYQPAETDDGVVALLRQGDVNVNFPGRRLSVSQAGLRPAIKKQFSSVFPEVLLDQPLLVPSDTQIQSMRGREFRPLLIDVDDGWLTIAVR